MPVLIRFMGTSVASLSDNHIDLVKGGVAFEGNRLFSLPFLSLTDFELLERPSSLIDRLLESNAEDSVNSDLRSGTLPCPEGDGAWELGSAEKVTLGCDSVEK